MIEAGLLFYDNRKTIDIEDMRVVLRGLVLAVLAYMSYAIGLTILNGFHPQDLIVAIILWAIYIWSMRTILPGVENEMRIPVLIYGQVLPFTFSRAVSIFYGIRFSTIPSIFLILGTLSLFIGDVEFAIQTFKRRLPFMLGPIL